MSPRIKAALATYTRALLASVITAIIALNISPLTMTRDDAAKLANAVWVSFLPVIMRALNPGDAAFGFKQSNSKVN